MSIEGRYRRLDGAPTTIEIIPIPNEQRYTMVRAIHIVEPNTHPLCRREETITMRRDDELMEWQKGAYYLEMLFKGGQLTVIERGADPSNWAGFLIEGLYQKAGLVVVR